MRNLKEDRIIDPEEYADYGRDEDAEDETFYLASYYDSRMRGLNDNYQTSDPAEAEDWAWEHLNQGGYIQIKNQKTGKSVYLDPDDLLFDYDDYASGAFEDAINDSGVLVDPEWHDTADQEQVDQPDYIPDGMDESMGKEIKRYSDVYSDERRNQGWWYFTTHGVQPGSVPKGVNILEVRDTPNGTYFRADAILNTSELEYYDIKERVPKEEESLKESSGKVYVVKTLQDYPYNGWVELMDKVDKNGEGEKHRFTDRDEVRKYAQELADQGYINWQGYPTAKKKPANTKINIRESLNKYDLRTDNKYDLRNLYDACIMTDKEKRIIAEMISKNARANVLYEALMNKFEGKPLMEATDDEYVQLVDMPKKERHKEEYAVTIWDSSDGRREFFNSLDDAIECAWEAMTNGLYAKIEGAGQRVMLSPQEVLSGYDCIRRHIEEVFDKWEVESLKEEDERNADLDKGIKDEQETINLYDKMSKKKVFNGVERDQIKEIRNDEKDHKRLLKKIKDGKLTRVEEAYDDAEQQKNESLKESKSLKESDFPYRSSGIDLEGVIQDLWERGSVDNLGEENWIEIFDPNEVVRLSNGEQGCSRIECTGNTEKRVFLSLQTSGWGLKYKFGFEDWKTAHSMDELWDEIVSRCNRQPEQESFKESTDGKFKFNSGDIAYTPIGRDIYIPVTIKDAWFGTEYGLTGNFYSYTYRDGSLCSSCPEQFLLTRDEVQKNGSRLIGESLKEGVNDRLRQIAEPLANALDELTDRDDGFYITYSIGMDDNGAVTGGVDFELFKSSRTEEEAKAEIERVFDENGFELDRRFKTNPGKTLFGRTHYQIIERDTK